MERFIDIFQFKPLQKATARPQPRPTAKTSSRSPCSGRWFYERESFLNCRANQKPEISSKKASFFEAEKSLVINERLADDDVIEKVDLKKASRFGYASRESNIGFRRGAISARMVVDQNQGIRSMNDCRTKNFPRMSHRFVDGTFADFNVAEGIGAILGRKRETKP
jgi:hypothetical protein